MPLFEVPGWTVPAAPVTDPLLNSRKRKRQSGNGAAHDVKLNSAVANVEKLMAKLGEEEDSSGGRPNKKKNKGSRDAGGKPSTKGREKGNGSGETSRMQEKGKKEGKDQGMATLSIKEGPEAEGKNGGKKKRKGKGQGVDEGKASKPADAQAQKNKPAIASQGLTALQNNMKQSLDGARFRYVLRLIGRSGPFYLLTFSLHQMDKRDAV